MPNGLWPSLCQTGLAAALPTSLSEFPSNTFCFYFATDTLILYAWNPTTGLWSTFSSGPAQLLAAAGETQGNATAITATLAIVTAYATTTHNGVVLPAAATGREVTVANKTGGGIKVYPALHQYIAAGASNVADTILATKKANTYIAVDTSHWVVQRGS